MTLSRTDASSQLDGAGLRARRALGQNFVVDANTVRRIARLADVGNQLAKVESHLGAGVTHAYLAAIPCRLRA